MPRLAFLHASEARTNKIYIFQQWTYILYIYYIYHSIYLVRHYYVVCLNVLTIVQKKKNMWKQKWDSLHERISFNETYISMDENVLLLNSISKLLVGLHTWFNLAFKIYLLSKMQPQKKTRTNKYIFATNILTNK